MSLRFFADHCVPTSVSMALRNAGHEVFLLREHLPTDAPDQAVIAKAQEVNALLLSLNGDFADIVAYPPSDFGGIVAMQIANRPDAAAQAVARLIGYLADHPDPSEYAGKLLVVEPHRIRIRG